MQSLFSRAPAREADRLFVAAVKTFSARIAVFVRPLAFVFRTLFAARFFVFARIFPPACFLFPSRFAVFVRPLSSKLS